MTFVSRISYNWTEILQLAIFLQLEQGQSEVVVPEEKLEDCWRLNSRL